MAYNADFVEISSIEIELTGTNQPSIPIQCEDPYTGLDLESITTIEFMSVGGLYLFPFVYNYDGDFVEIANTIDFFTDESSLSLNEIQQTKIGEAVVYRIKSLRPKDGDDCIELVLTDLSYVYDVDFVSNPTYGRIPLTVQFYSLVPNKRDISHFLWDFGDGSISTEENPVHIYTDVGKYDVSLTIVDFYDERRFTTRKITYINTVEREQESFKRTKCFCLWVPVR